MRVINLSKNTAVATSEILMSNAESSPVSHKSYHEMSEVSLVEKDSLAQLHSNLEMLADLSNRLSFVMKEVRYVLKA